MSAQAGILYKDRRPIEPELVSNLAASIQSAGPHGGGHYAGAGIAMVYQAVHFDDLAALESQPGILPDGRVLTWDGRLDNRDDLLLQLGRTIQGPPTDIAIVAKAIERWNLDTLERLIGDWSLVLWDPRSEELVLARDYMGTRPLLYLQRGDCFVWSTCLKTIKGLFDLGDEINEHYLAGLLTFSPPPYQRFYKGLLDVPASYLVRVTSRIAVAVSRYRDLPNDRLRYRDPREYEIHFRELFHQAVEVRLRSSRTVWAELSGGYDSSSVVCMAHHITTHGPTPRPPIQPVSNVFPDSPESDESTHIQQIERWIGREARKLRILTRQEETDWTSSTTDTEVSEHSEPTTITGMMESDDAYVLLSGELGDLAMAKGSNNCVALLEHLAEWRLSAFLTGVLQFSRVRRTPWYQNLWRVLEPIFPRTYDPHAKRLLMVRDTAKARGLSSRHLADVYGLTDDFARRAAPMPIVPPSDITRFPPSKRALATGLYNFQLYSWLATRAGSSPVRRTHPFAHRPLVDFLLAVPQDVLWEPTRLRSFMRRALAGFVPDAVLNRGDKGYASPIVARVTLPAAHALLVEPLIDWEMCRRGYLDPTRFQRLLANPLPREQIASSGGLQAVIRLEMWFRSKRLPSVPAD